VSNGLRVVCSSVAATGHFLPALALALRLKERGMEVSLNVPGRWRDTVEEFGIALLAWDEGDPGRVVPSIASQLREERPHLLVGDPFAPAPMLAAEVAGTKTAALFPDPYYAPQPGLPVFVQGLLPPRTRLGRAAWKAVWPLADRAMRRTLAIQNDLRAQVGLQPRERFNPAISDGPALVATFPQLEYPRIWPPRVHVTGPLLIDLSNRAAKAPEGDNPLVVVVASTTGLDSPVTFVRVVLDALAEEPVRVLASLSERGMRWPGPTPENAVVVDWLQLSRAASDASAVVCHGGHGTVAGALSAGAPVLVCPMGGNTAQTGARVAWARVGMVLPPRLFAPGPVRWAVRRMIADEALADGARRMAAWARQNDGPALAAELISRYARL
jgi:UDP:flavonoid glycosyltransferase YjiC (YdhE family)